MTKLTDYEIIKVLNNFIGETTAYGDLAVDREIKNNLEKLIVVTNWCLEEVLRSSYARHNYQGSMKDIGELAYSAIEEWREKLA